MNENATAGPDAQSVLCRVFLVDDHAVFRSGVRAELANEPGLHVVGEADTVADSITAITRLRPDVVLLDVHMPAGGGDPFSGREQEAPRRNSVRLDDDDVDVPSFMKR